MITSLSRLVRQVFLGARAQPTSQAMMDPAAAEVAQRRENLKRAMEIAFAAPAAALEPARGVAVETSPREEQVQARASIAEPDAAAEHEASLAVEIGAEPRDPAFEAVKESNAAPAEEQPAVGEAVAEDIGVEQIGEPAAVAEEVTAEAAGEAEIAIEAPPELEAFAAEEAPAAEAASDEAAIDAPAAPPARAKKAGAKKKKVGAGLKRAASKKAAGPKAALTADDEAWLSDAVAYSLSGAWSNAWAPPEDGAALARLEEFRAKAAEGLITLWGRAEGAPEWGPIKASYWKTGRVETLSFLKGREYVAAEPEGGTRKKTVKYAGLKVSKAAVEDLWPAGAGAPEVRDAA